MSPIPVEYIVAWKTSGGAHLWRKAAVAPLESEYEMRRNAVRAVGATGLVRVFRLDASVVFRAENVTTLEVERV